MICILAVSVPMSLSASIYLHITQGTGKEAYLALAYLKIGMVLLVVAPCLFLIVSVPFRYVLLHKGDQRFLCAFIWKSSRINFGDF